MVKPGRNRANKVNGRLSLEPQLDAEYMELLSEYKRDERKKRKFESPPASPGNVKSEPNGNRAPSPSAANFEEIDLRNDQSHNALPSTTFGMELESDSESEFDEFEDVDLDDANPVTDHGDGIDYAGPQDVTVSLDESQARSLTRKRKEKGLPRQTRIAIHKTSLIVWMVHSRLRSIWLSSPECRNHVVLNNVFRHQVMQELFPPDHLTDFLKSKRLISGVKAAVEEWKLKFRVVRSGLASVDDDRGDPAERQEYLDDLFNLQGSADMLCQGFFAVMRSLGFRTRLVCSLQPPDNLGSTAVPMHKTSKSESPIFWTEIWDKWAPGWISVDPLTSTVRLPIGNKSSTAIEPKAADHLNVMRYCIAWEQGRARDVTRRYASHFNARTRKKRLPHFEGDEWLNRMMAYFGPTKYTRTDVAEVKELVKCTRREGIPKRVQDFVGHPQYALSDKLHHNELLRPGAVPCGTLANKGKQPVTYIYDRRDVMVAHSAQSWYRKGRALKAGAQAVLRRQVRNRLTGETESVGLYTNDQTELYIPPPVDADGVVPKSQYRTIDIFTDTMIPRGAVYIRDPLAVEAARILRIDYANAVTTIEFSKRGPQSKMFGVIIAKENEPSTQLVLQGLREQQRNDSVRKEDARILALWRQYIVGIQIWDRIEQMNPQSNKSSGGDQDHDNLREEFDSDSSASGVSPITSTDNLVENHGGAEISAARSDLEQSSALSRPRDASPRRLDEESAEPPIRKNTIRIDEFGSSPLPEVPPKFNGAHPKDAAARSSAEKRQQIDNGSSPESHSSFSDLDVDEISESELKLDLLNQ